MTISSSDIGNTRTATNASSDIGLDVSDALSTEVRDQRNRDRLTIHDQANTDMGGMQIFAFLFMMFLSTKDQNGNSPLDQDTANEISDSLGLDKTIFHDRINSVRNGDISAFTAARDSRNSIDLSRANLQEAEIAIAKYTGGGNQLLELIANKESNGDYNRVYGAGVRRESLTEMSINQVIAWQKDYTDNKGSPSSAAGKYQIIRKTLEGLVSNLGLTGNEIFDEDMQDRMANTLLVQRGYNDYLSGDLPEDVFMENIAKEWASMPKDESGLSYYHGDNLNKAHTTPATLLLAMRNTKKDITSQEQGLKQQFAQGGVEGQTSMANLTPVFTDTVHNGGVDQIAAASNEAAFDQPNNDGRIIFVAGAKV